MAQLSGIRLEDGIVAEIGVGDEGFQAAEFLGDVVQIADDPQQGSADGPVETLADTALLQAEVSQVEEVEGVLPELNRIVVGLQKVLPGKVVGNPVQV